MAEESEHRTGPRESLGRAIQVFRAERGLGRRDLAESADLSYSYLSEIETGKKQPSASAVQQLARALEIPLSELVAEAERLERERITREEDADILSDSQLHLLAKRVMRRGRTSPGHDPRGARARQQRWLDQPLDESALRDDASTPPTVSEPRSQRTRDLELELLLDEMHELLRHSSRDDRLLLLTLARRLGGE